VSERPLTFEEKCAIARAPITRGILAERIIGGFTSGGAGSNCHTMPIRNNDGFIVGTRKLALKTPNA
jgi:hypothetical protein